MNKQIIAMYSIFDIKWLFRCTIGITNSLTVWTLDIFWFNMFVLHLFTQNKYFLIIFKLCNYRNYENVFVNLYI